MFRGYYIAANGILNQQRNLETISNNIANSTTAGYKSDKNIPTTFDERLLLIRGKKNESGTILYRTVDYVSTSLDQGSFEFTESRLDVALKGNVYFNLQPTSAQYQGAGEALLTRNGQFNIDDEGYLALGSSGRVLGTDGPIQLGTADFSIDETGLITTEDGRTFQLALTYVAPDTDVLKKGDNMFALAPDADGNLPDGQIPADAEYAVLQGAFERSNVDMAEQTTQAMAAQNLFTANSQMLKLMDAVNQRTAELGRM